MRDNIFGKNFCDNFRERGCKCPKEETETETETDEFIQYANQDEESTTSQKQLSSIRQSFKEMAQLKNMMDGCPTKGCRGHLSAV